MTDEVITTYFNIFNGLNNRLNQIRNHVQLIFQLVVRDDDQLQNASERQIRSVLPVRARTLARAVEHIGNYREVLISPWQCIPLKRL